MLEILAHSNLTHELVFVSVHPSQLTDVREHVLQSIGELIRVDVTETELHVGIHHELGETQDFAAEVERVPKSTLLTLLCRQRFHGLQVEVVVQVQVVQVLSMNQEIEHVVTLPTHLQTDFDPVELGALEEFRLLQRDEQVSALHRLRRALMQLVQHETFQQLLIRHANLDRVARRAVLVKPVVHQGHVHRATRLPAPQVERSRCIEKCDPTRSVVRVKRGVF